MEASDLENRFSYHAPSSPEVGQAHDGVRAACLALADYLNDAAPDSREKSLAMTSLEQVMFWANAAIARKS